MHEIAALEAPLAEIKALSESTARGGGAGAKRLKEVRAGSRADFGLDLADRRPSRLRRRISSGRLAKWNRHAFGARRTK